MGGEGFRKIRSGERAPLPGRGESLLKGEMDFLAISVGARDLTGYHDPTHLLASTMHHHLQVHSLFRAGDVGPHPSSGLPLPPIRRVPEEGLRGLPTRGEGPGHLHVAQPIGLVADAILESRLIFPHAVPIVSRHSQPSPVSLRIPFGPASLTQPRMSLPGAPRVKRGRTGRIPLSPDPTPPRPRFSLTPHALPVILPEIPHESGPLTPFSVLLDGFFPPRVFGLWPSRSIRTAPDPRTPPPSDLLSAAHRSVRSDQEIPRGHRRTQEEERQRTA